MLVKQEGFNDIEFFKRDDLDHARIWIHRKEHILKPLVGKLGKVGLKVDCPESLAEAFESHYQVLSWQLRGKTLAEYPNIRFENGIDIIMEAVQVMSQELNANVAVLKGNESFKELETVVDDIYTTLVVWHMPDKGWNYWDYLENLTELQKKKRVILIVGEWASKEDETVPDNDFPIELTIKRLEE